MNIYKYLRMAKQFGEDSNPCFSRNIGVVIVDPNRNRVSGTGYNGPPSKTPHCDQYEYYVNYLFPLCTDAEYVKLQQIAHSKCEKDKGGSTEDERIAAKLHNCGQCPRNLLGYRNGIRAELCSCQHAERNAITNASCDLHGHIMCCWCGVPCGGCAGAIINAGIAQVHCLKREDKYIGLKEARWLLHSKGIVVKEHLEEDVLNGSTEPFQW